jgi:hypothetical protein
LGSRTEGEEMNPLGLSLVVGGLAFLISGLLFLLSKQRKQSAQQETIKESMERIDHHLREMRRDRGDPS